MRSRRIARRNRRLRQAARPLPFAAARMVRRAREVADKKRPAREARRHKVPRLRFHTQAHRRRRIPLPVPRQARRKLAYARRGHDALRLDGKQRIAAGRVVDKRFLKPLERNERVWRHIACGGSKTLRRNTRKARLGAHEAAPRQSGALHSLLHKIRKAGRKIRRPQHKLPRGGRPRARALGGSPGRPKANGGGKEVRQGLGKIHHAERPPGIRRDTANGKDEPQWVQGRGPRLQCRGNSSVARRIRARGERLRSPRSRRGVYESPHRIHAARRRVGQQLGHAEFQVDVLGQQDFRRLPGGIRRARRQESAPVYGRPEKPRTPRIVHRKRPALRRPALPIRRHTGVHTPHFRARKAACLAARLPRQSAGRAAKAPPERKGTG